MNKKFASIFSAQKIIIAFISCAIFIACEQVNEKKATNENTMDAQFVSSAEVNFPDAPGAQTFKENCITCHSARYVEMQPDFSVKTWEKTVDKMIKIYGAPISDSSAKVIVDYLVAIKGKK